MAREPTETALVAELNDMLQLDDDAIAAYTLAIEHLEPGRSAAWPNASRAWSSLR